MKETKKITKAIAKALMPLLECHHRRWIAVRPNCGLPAAKRYQAAGLIELSVDGDPAMRLTGDGRAALREYLTTHVEF